MACFHPVQGFQRRDNNGIGWGGSQVYSDRPMTVPCGHCIGCVKRSKRDWSIRIMHEAQMHADNWFATLTYDDEHLPEGGTLIRTDPPKFVRALRRKGHKLSYFAMGEYGSEKLRPHYHLALFGLRLDDVKESGSKKQGASHTSEEIATVWGKGFAPLAPLTPGAAAYIAGYIQKKGDNKEERSERYERGVSRETGEIYTVLPERPTMSNRPAIGRRWIERFWREVYPNDFVVMNGQEIIPPRYYDRWLSKNQPDTWEKVQTNRARIRRPEDYTPERLSVREVCETARQELYRGSKNSIE